MSELELARAKAAAKQKQLSLAGSQPKIGVGEDMRRSFDAGMVRGTSNLLDLPGMAFNFVGGKIVDGLEAAGVVSDELGDATRDALTRGPMGSGATARGTAEAALGDEVNYQGQTTPGRYAGTTGEFLPGSLLGGNIVSQGVIPAVASEAAGQATEGMTFPEQLPLIGGQDVEPYARTAAAVAAPFAENVVRSAVTPNPAPASRVQAAEKLKNEGVTVTAGQKTGSQRLKWRESRNPRMDEVVANQDEQFTRAALKRIGVDASEASPTVMVRAANDIGRRISDSVKGVSLRPSFFDMNQSANIVADYVETTAKANISPIIKKTANRIESAAKSKRPIQGDVYRKWRSQLSKLTVSSDAQLKEAAKDMIEVLDSVMDRAVTAMGDPARVAEYAKARTQWRDYLAIETAVSRAGEGAASGVINPQTLRSAIVQQGKRPYVQGKRDLGELAREGSKVTGELPATGSAPRMTNMTEAATVGGAVGAGVGAITKDPMLGTMAGAAAATVPTGVNALVGSRGGQAYLGNQLITQRNALSDAFFPFASSLNN